MPRLFGPRQVAQTFLTGVIAILPLALTFAILSWLVVLLHDLSGPSSTCGKILQSLGLSLVACELTAYLIGVVGAVLAVYCLGILIESNAGRRLQTTMDDALDRVPVLGTVYHASKQVTSVFDNDPESRQSMSPVLCYFGEGRSTVVPALMPTQEVVHLGDKQYHVVMIPTAPVPFSGALICVEASMVEKADCGFDDLVSMYMSLGMTAPRCLNQEQHKTQDAQPTPANTPISPQ